MAALSSCHMLTFLAIAARKRLVVDSYEDDAIGFMTKNAAGKLYISRVLLRPRVRFAESVDAEQVRSMHELSHRECFIANSVLTKVEVDVIQVAGVEVGRTSARLRNPKNGRLRGRSPPS